MSSPFSGYICRPFALRFVGDPRKVTAFHYQQAKSLECDDGKGLLSMGNSRTAIALDRDAAIDLVRLDVGNVLRGHPRLDGPAAFIPAHWELDVRTEQVRAGLFWHMPTTCPPTTTPL
jgi:hypothetical protein